MSPKSRIQQRRLVVCPAHGFERARLRAAQLRGANAERRERGMVSVH